MLGVPDKYLGSEVTHEADRSITLNQPQSLEFLLHHTGMTD